LILAEIEVGGHVVLNLCIVKFHENSFSGIRNVPRVWADRQMDRDRRPDVMM